MSSLVTAVTDPVTASPEALADDELIERTARLVSNAMPDAVDQLDGLLPHRLDEDMDAFYRAESLEPGEKTQATTKEEGTPKESANGSTSTSGKNAIERISDLTPSTCTSRTASALTAADVSSTAPAPHCHKPNRYVTSKDFELLKVIGMGAFGKVLQVRNKSTKKVLAMKVISKRLLRRKGGYIDNVRAERNIMTKVRHPFIVTMHCSFQTREKLFIIMDFLAGGELFLRLGREGIFLEKTAAFYLAEIILALDHLHQHNVLHRDLKPENILLGSDGHVCLTDFGLAKDFGDRGLNDEDEEGRALTVCGTQEYMAPEMVARKGYGRAADYWSLGCIAYEMLKGLPPFSSRDGSKELFRKIMSERVKMPDGASAAACKLLKGLLNRNVQNRLGTAKSTMFEVGGVAGLKKQPFFDKIDWDKLERKEVEPPERLDVQNDEDLRHFHDEFTNMALPRSVVVMNRDDYRNRRVESEAFRGFSFIQDDFALPDRQDSEMKHYWESVEEDGESVSETASSKLDFTEDALKEETPAKKKRPPRKRKKKKAGAAGSVGTATPIHSTMTTPVASAATTPVQSRTNSPVPIMKDLSEPPPTTTKQGDASPVTPKETPVSTPPQSSPVLVIPVAPVPPKKKTEETWQKASPKKKGANRLNGKAPASLPKQQRAPAQSQSSTRQYQQQQTPGNRGYVPVGAGRQTTTPKAAGAWSTVSARQPPPTATRSPQPAPSSDWRQHALSPRSPGRTVRPVNVSSDAFPSLPGAPAAPVITTSTDPPLSSTTTTSKSVPLQGAWVTRTKKR